MENAQITPSENIIKSIQLGSSTYRSKLNKFNTYEGGEEWGEARNIEFGSGCLS
jgi:hypothetical protein